MYYDSQNDSINTNYERYFKLNEYSKYLKRKENPIEQPKELLSIMKGIKDFNINTLVPNYQGKYKLTTVLSYILKIDKPNIAEAVYDKYLDEIQKDIYVDKNLKLNLLTVLYFNSIEMNYDWQLLLRLIYKIEDLNFIEDIKNIDEKKMVISKIVEQRESFECSETFSKDIDRFYKKILKQKEVELIDITKKYMQDMEKSLSELCEEPNFIPGDDAINIIKKLKLMLG